jgi:hypothetical protein
VHINPTVNRDVLDRLRRVDERVLGAVPRWDVSADTYYAAVASLADGTVKLN